MKDIETIRIILRRKYMKITAPLRKKFIHNDNFTIISNNCWGGFIYQSYQLKYFSPTIGTFFMANDYILYLENFQECLTKKIIFIDPKNSKYYEELRSNKKFGSYPIGIIEIDRGEKIEIHFMHYTSSQDALNKWQERTKRINLDKIIFKFNDQNGCTMNHIKRFEDLPYQHKLFFGTKPYTKDCICIHASKNKSFIPTSYEPFGRSKYLNINKYINDL